MDSSGNGFNKAVVFLAVAIIGMAAGQFLIPRGNSFPPGSPWATTYSNQPQYPQGGLEYHQGNSDSGFQSTPAPVARSGSPRSRSESNRMRLVSFEESELQNDVPLPVEDLRPAPPPVIASRSLPSLAINSALAGQVPDAPQINGVPDCTIEFIEDQGVLWSDERVWLNSTSANLYLRLTGGSGIGLTVKVVTGAGEVIVASDTKLGAPIQANLYGPIPFTVKTTVVNSASFSVKLQKTADNVMTEGGASPLKTVTTPGAAGIPTSITIQPGPAASVLDLDNRNEKTPVQVRSHFARLKGSTTAPTVQVQVLACVATNKIPNRFTPVEGGLVTITKAPGSNQWEITPALTTIADGNLVRLLVRSMDEKYVHMYAASPIDIQLQPPASVSPTDLGITNIEQLQDDGKTVDSERKSPRFNRRTLKITCKVPKITAVPDGFAVLIADGAVVPGSKKALVDQDSTYEVNWTASADGKHSLAVAILQDEKEIARSAPTASFEIRQTGPRATHISPDNLALTPGVAAVDVYFDGPIVVSGTAAEVKELFTFDPALSGTTTFTATVAESTRIHLEFDKLPPNNYKLTVKRTAGAAKIEDQFGNPLGAAPTDDKLAFQFILRNPVDAELSVAPSAGLRNLTGPNVPYQEYTQPRDSQSGFNPSDKVVTRIARLYYFRDAHRVLQIIKRDAARSYNRQAVDMQQQLADAARRGAENATASRQAAERNAIQAAQRARSGEAALLKFQSALAQARSAKDNADEAIRQQKSAYPMLQQDLSAKTAAREKLESTKDTPRTKPNEPTPYENAVAAENNAKRAVAQSEDSAKQLSTEQSNAVALIAEREKNINAILADVQNSRDAEAKACELTFVKQAEEDRLLKDFFRRETAAATEDPDTYAPGVPTSQDPIEQVSMAVIGEGVIQMRGPLKGVNLARTLINQIDAPVGQVRVAIHTVQVNGEHGKRMEPVIGRIQRYIDHSRFLTTQSAQMLRNAVTLVASRRAEQALVGCEALTQFERDQKYIESFFGAEFLAELRTLDSEFLHTGNKLLSLHSMDSTSLSNALFILSLAKNDVRQEILSVFEQLVACQLPQDEQEYFTASAEKYKFGPPLHKSKFEFLGHNAKFVSLRGFFNANVAGAETLTPMQREFIRLAQIFKSRLVTEIQLEQRVMERTLLEERLNRSPQDNSLVLNDEAAQAQLKQVQQKRRQSQQAVVAAASNILVYVNAIRSSSAHAKAQIASFDTILNDVFTALLLESQTPPNNNKYSKTNAKSILTNFRNKQAEVLQTGDRRDTKKLISPTLEGELQDNRDVSVLYDVDGTNLRFVLSDFSDDLKNVQISVIKEDKPKLQRIIRNYMSDIVDIKHSLDNFSFDDARKTVFENANTLCDGVTASLKGDGNPVDALLSLQHALMMYGDLTDHVESRAAAFNNALSEIQVMMAEKEPRTAEAWGKWRMFQMQIDPYLQGKLKAEASPLFQAVGDSFRQLIGLEMDLVVSSEFAASQRRPLEHKKFLDMLIDDVEEKFIELAEGTRAHTANIDNYLSRVSQALEDDFNTQFYFPAFRGIREASRFWDVNLGAVETTSVLTNNRTFAKVSPQATMEFDLPKRDILINEAFKSAKAAYDDYGALMSDPSFLALAKMHRGQPASATFGNGNGNPTTRNVLPGLPSSTDEKLVAQNQAVSPDFPSALESLIPDPAIYKFETGTGFEIRPVIQPDGQAVVFHLNYMYTTNVREPVRPDEKHLGRVKRHFIDTDVQTGNYELREVSRYQVALKASRTSRGVPLLEDLPGVGAAFRPLPNQESSIQENLILAQTVIFPTLFDLMGLRWAPAVADLDALRLHESDFVARGRQRALRERVFDVSSGQVDEFMRIPQSERRGDLYRPQETIPSIHPNGYRGPGLNQMDGTLREHNPGSSRPEFVRPESQYVPGTDREGSNGRGSGYGRDVEMQYLPPQVVPPLPAPSGARFTPVPSVAPRGLNPPPQPLAPHERTVQSRSNPRAASNSSSIELQTYRVEEAIPAGKPAASKPPARTTTPQNAPKASGPVPRNNSTSALLPSTSRLSMEPLESGFSAPLPAPPPSKLVSSPKGQTSKVVPASATELIRPIVVEEPAKSGRKFNLWPKKP